ncbi:hypothetical protein ACFSYB_08150 [Litchfieldia salsa]
MGYVAVHASQTLFDQTNGKHPKIFISSNGDVINSSYEIGARGHSISAYDPKKHNNIRFMRKKIILISYIFFL